ncbi:ATP synthase subunit 4 mitochondrial precursor [Eremomyces bilateralis CBS 781.70]|uniref:ATP synthase subunit 4 n=1 Tax=Eremomyces bilateralis CBS 781.70 TaxID=1392243 RepID=A0A6G1G7G0_9PEZI|nr:ATP synthase subunit 4 mitochondrial precursor [Eremomyces bilateralis CBS 781.70]KAF1814007.1 ATP synthase subunit 4 mitochondrial precursor [Eremomyces bilateralis CBS 781.70]
MASKLARSAVGAARLRPTIPLRSIPAVTTPLTSSRSNSNVPAEDPKNKAQSILNSLPGQSVPAKLAFLSGGTGLSVAAISNELYVFNEETIVAFSLLTIFYAVGKYVAPMAGTYAKEQTKKLSDILNSARHNHTAAVQARIANVKELEGVVDITKTLFEVSKETAKLEAQAYELEQKTAIASEAKAVLDSWVRYEGQIKQKQQRELAESVIAKVEKDLENPKVLKQILDQSVADVERILAVKS